MQELAERPELMMALLKWLVWLAFGMAVWAVCGILVIALRRWRDWEKVTQAD